MKRHAVLLADQHEIDLRLGPDKLLPRLKDNEEVLLAAYDVVTKTATSGRFVPSEAWLLDNFYLIEQQIGLARGHLPRGYSQQLPRLKTGLSAGYPRVYDLAFELICHGDGRLDSENVTQFIASYQTVIPLKLGELWAFPIMLRLALLENLRRVAVQIARRHEEREVAIAWTDRMLLTAEQEPGKLVRVLADFVQAEVALTAAFVEEFYARLQAQGPAMAFVQTWLEHKLAEQGVTATQLTEVAARTAAANQISIANSIGSLRFIGSMDWKTYVETLSLVEQTLQGDPAGTYRLQDFATRDRYRHVIEDVARGSRCSEVTVAQTAIRLALSAAAQLGPDHRSAHVGYYLKDRGRRLLKENTGCELLWRTRMSRVVGRFQLWLYLGVIFAFTVAASAGVLALSGWGTTPGWKLALISVPLFIGSSALVVSLVNMLLTLLLPPRVLPRLDFSEGIPEQHRTMVVVPTLLAKASDIDDLLENLEIRYLGNRDANVFFALLTDFPDADAAVLPEDDGLIQRARAEVERLNLSYRGSGPDPFYLFHRPRLWNPVDQVWMGYERKRGKLEQFNALLRGEAEGAFSDMVGDCSILHSIRYVITLDTDTHLPRDTARALVGNMAHPLNRPVYDAARGRIVEGYAILQPRASISLNSAGRSRFARLYAGESGIDPYTREVSDVYQDIFAEGSFIGKGIYDVDAFRLAVDGRFPENLILSHDLLEGGYARSALITDVDLIEDYPPTYAMDASRRHRWIRGDWQLLYWLLPWVPTGVSATATADAGLPSGKPAPEWQPNPLTALSRWKLLDNLRRSLVPPALVALLGAGWVLGIGTLWLWPLLILLVVYLPAVIHAVIDLARKPPERDWIVHLKLAIQSAQRPLATAVLTLMLLPYEAWLCLDAIGRSGVRMLYTRQGLLLWQLPYYRIRNACLTLTDYVKEMWVAPVLVAVLCAAMLLSGVTLSAWAYLAPVFILWLLSPVAVWWISQPAEIGVSEISPHQQAFLRTSARRTWRFFDEFVGPADNWLPPDNYQEYPEPLIASRTSPTNMGMSLLADLAASDFGYISAGECLQRVGATLSSMEQLERYRGHFFNWYDTRTLELLRPQYVSSVDSGNLVGCLLTLQAGLAEFRCRPIVSPLAFQGLQDTLRVLAEHLPVPAPAALAKTVQQLQLKLESLTQQHTPPAPAGVRQALKEVAALAEALLDALAPDTEAELDYWARALVRQCRGITADLDCLLPDNESFDKMPSLEELADALGEMHSQPRQRLALISELVERCCQMALMDFDFLFDRTSGLLAIGYDVGERRRDPSCYDLLASEARLASFLVIAQGQVPQKHWFSLGRLLTSHGADVSLISWSGSMFEYLMPQLIMPGFAGTLLDQACKAAVARQIEYGQQRSVPWGISESCYNATDMDQVYQYRAFGVPGLGFKRGLGDDLVIAPYASALALTVMPDEASRNLQVLADSGFLGAYGFYEAIDYTPARLPRGKTFAVVRCYMAHHQGMSLLAFAHVLLTQPMQRRFMSDPQARATELLLQERVPKLGATVHPHAAEVSAAARPPEEEMGSVMRVFANPDMPLPEVHLLSNGSYHVMVTHSGGSYSRWRDLAITRWREDVTSDNWGTFVYLRDRDTGLYWSSAYQPTLRKADRYEAIFVQERAEYRRCDQDVEAHTELSVSPEDDVEIRRITLTNQSSRPRRIEMTSYTEVVLAPLNADLAHRAFSNLFVQTEILPEHRAILCTRRRRIPGESVPWMFHLFTAPERVTGTPSFETDRARFIGRGRTAGNPAMLDASASAELSNTEGPVLDPIVAIRRTVRLAADDCVTVQVITGAASTREAAIALIEKYSDYHFVDRAFEMAWFQSQEVLCHLNAKEAEIQVFGRLANSVIYATALRRAQPGVIVRNQLGQAGLWRFGISGDLPIVLLQIADINRIDLVRQVLQAHAYWRLKGLVADLVIVNEDFSGYRAELQDRIIGLINTGPEAYVLDRQGGVFVRRSEELSEDERVLLQTVARIVFSDSTETLIEQVERRASTQRISDQLRPSRKRQPEMLAPLPARDLLFDNGLGGFAPDGKEYVIRLEPGETTPAPWCNVIASPYIGTVVSESGSAYTWVENAHEFRLTTWHNDPLSDTTGEAFYIRDEETGAYWSPTPLPARGRSGYLCRHGFGYSVFEHSEGAIRSELSTFVAMDAPVKFVVVRLHNQSDRPRQLSLSGYWELVMGEWRHANLMHIVSETDPYSGALFARNAYGRECAGRVFFAHVSEPDQTQCGNRGEFIGRNGSLRKPAAMRRTQLSGGTGAGLDPCAGIQANVELDAGQTTEIVFVFGAAGNAAEARDYIERFGTPAGAGSALEAVHEYWQRTLGAVQVDTPDPALNIMTNGWLVYQTLSCRYWGRSGYYQSGGAFGFRDQLQDSLALMHTTPAMVREQLLRCAGRQFLKGDVQHWWHPPTGQGVRTRFSDDYLWLPYVTCRYVAATGDTSVLDEQVHFIEGRELNLDEEAYYDQPQRSPIAASLYEHCVSAIRYGLKFGPHHLPLMGCGDWNDGMNLVGPGGRGESVWLAWFLYDNLQGFAALAQTRSDASFAEECRTQAETLRGHVESSAWDGAWYRRAWFDDGTPLGSSTNNECRIDSISQSWSIISGGGDPVRARQAMEAVNQQLVSREAQLIRLLDPPFDHSELEPGYIKGYVPGVRENGGQYTHAAIWTTMAFAMLGDAERAWELYRMLNPINHGHTPEAIALYKVEPYVMSADVYGSQPHTGRGGWTWYTGASGWMYRLTLETLLGLQLEVDYLRIAPCLPAGWPSCKIRYRYRETVYQINIRRTSDHSQEVIRVVLDGQTLENAGKAGTEQGRIPLLDDRQAHEVNVELG
ncbi:MAG: glucoamylase family protein [Halopseudomonas sp.]